VQVLNRGALIHITTMDQRSAALCADFFRYRFHLFDAPSGADHVGSGFGQPQPNCMAQTGGPAQNHRYPGTQIKSVAAMHLHLLVFGQKFSFKE